MPSKSAVGVAVVKRSGWARISVLAVTGVAALGTVAGRARAADGFALQLSTPAPAVVGQPVTLTAIGKNPALADYPYVTYLDVDLFGPGAVSACPATESAAGQLAPNTGGSLLAFDVEIAIDATGNFSIPVGFVPEVPGPFLLCGYTAGLAGETLAAASVTIPVASAGGAPGGGAPGGAAPGSPAPGSAGAGSAAPGKPRNLAPPRLRRSGGRVICDAGRWANSPTRFTYGWLVDGHAKRGATGRSMAITRRLRGHKVRCGVSAANGTGRGTALSQTLAIR